ncbi:apolipoprotein A-I-like isoform X5 [Zootoca vivipara]|uniref:apolipoprotein A-I-like isoform X5 n=1 Tax=Zootoca vivipara TaxID=8524 RepID=UPI00293BB07C|nr:apolipoprotein A-I-like isoform X5 [Zootoca vivipara]
MKLIVITLVLYLFTGHPTFAQTDKRVSKLDQLKHDLTKFLGKVSEKAWDKLNFVRRSRLGQELRILFRDDVAKLRKFFQDLQAELPPEITQAYHAAVQLSGHALVGASCNLAVLRSATEELYEGLESLVTFYTSPVAEKLGPHTQALRNMVVPRVQELEEKLKQQVEERGPELIPYARKLHRQLHEYQRSLEPYANQAQEKIKLGIETFSQTMQRYVTPLLEAIKKRNTDS